MKANTIKIEEELLKKIYPLLNKKQSLASFVRNTLEKEVLRQQLKESATTYQKYLESSSAEKDLLSEWESAPLEKEPSIKRKKKVSKR